MLLAETEPQSLGLLQALLDEWYVTGPLLLASVGVFTLAIERILFLRKAQAEAGRLHRTVLELVRQGNFPEAAALCDGKTGGGMYASVLELSQVSPQAVAPMVERRRLAEVARLKRNVWVIGSMGNLAPFIGLLGTVIGIMKAFAQIAAKGSGGFAVVSKGIAGALVATALGLAVGIVAVMAYNFLNVRIAALAETLRGNAEEFLEHLAARARGKLPSAAVAAPPLAASVPVSSPPPVYPPVR